jgi:hypothetical protein
MSPSLNESCGTLPCPRPASHSRHFIISFHHFVESYLSQRPEALSCQERSSTLINLSYKHPLVPCHWVTLVARFIRPCCRILVRIRVDAVLRGLMPGGYSTGFGLKQTLMFLAGCFSCCTASPSQHDIILLMLVFRTHPDATGGLHTTARCSGVGLRLISNIARASYERCTVPATYRKPRVTLDSILASDQMSSPMVKRWRHSQQFYSPYPLPFLSATTSGRSRC